MVIEIARCSSPIVATEAQEQQWASEQRRKELERYNERSSADVPKIFDDIDKIIVERGGHVTSLPSDSEIRFDAPVDTPIAEQLAAIKISPGSGQHAKVLALRALGDGQRIIDGRLCAVRRYAFNLSCQ